jgi:hypothetical protein
MQSHKKVKRTKRPEVRSLKIQPHFRFNRDKEEAKQVPEIKLCGNWLEKPGFLPEQRVSVTTMDGLLIIRREQ